VSLISNATINDVNYLVNYLMRERGRGRERERGERERERII